MGGDGAIVGELRGVPPRAPERHKVLPDAVLGMAIFVVTEVMFFAGFISAFVVAKAGAPVWPPPDQPRLPVGITAVNTLILLASGVALYYAGKRYLEGTDAQARTPMVAAAGLGTLFVVVQGYEWVNLINHGLTLTGSTYGAFFFLIIGAHALHAIAGIVALVWMVGHLNRGTITPGGFQAGRIFWYFVVAVWPVLYWQVYW